MASSSFAGTPAVFIPGTMPPSVWKHSGFLKAETQTVLPACSPALRSVEDPTETLQTATAALQCPEGPCPLTTHPIDPATREQMLLDHIPTVRFVARRLHERLPQHVELEDLVGAGIVGLIDAMDKFDFRKNVQFRSYAQFRIRGAILDSLRTLDWGSRDLRRKGRSIDEAWQKLNQSLGRRPSESEMCHQLGMTLHGYQQLLGELKGLEIGSLNDFRFDDSPEEELAHVPADPDEDPLRRCIKSEMSSWLSAAVAKLSEREAKVLALYYVEEMTMKEIGAALGVVESRVSQIHSSAVVALRNKMVRAGKLTRSPASTGTRMNTHKQEQIEKSSNRKGLVPAALVKRQRVARNCGLTLQ